MLNGVLPLLFGHNENMNTSVMPAKVSIAFHLNRADDVASQVEEIDAVFVDSGLDPESVRYESDNMGNEAVYSVMVPAMFSAAILKDFFSRLLFVLERTKDSYMSHFTSSTEGSLSI